MNVLITGATGQLGRELAPIAAAAGHTVRIMSRHARPAPSNSPAVSFEWAQADIASGQGVPEAVEGIDAVFHLASDLRQSEAVDVDGTWHLTQAAHQAGVGHLIYVSIVGIDDIPLGYYKRKRQAEGIVASSGVPHSILRATQFHSLLDSLVSAAARVPLVMSLPTDFQYQGVAEQDVAQRLICCLAQGPGGRLADFGGPQVLTLGDIARSWLEVHGIRRRLIHLPLPGPVAAGFRAGKNTVPSDKVGAGMETEVGTEVGTVDWREWLRGRKTTECGKA